MTVIVPAVLSGVGSEELRPRPSPGVACEFLAAELVSFPKKWGSVLRRLGSTMQLMGTAQAPAGWYPIDGQQRYWDGSHWTEHYAPLQLSESPASTQSQVVVESRKMYKTSHAFHLIMSIITFGFWLPIWLIMGIYNSIRR